MGTLMRRYWQPVLLAREVAEPAGNRMETIGI
jgi:hypothetical protein